MSGLRWPLNDRSGVADIEPVARRRKQSSGEQLIEALAYLAVVAAVVAAAVAVLVGAAFADLVAILVCKLRKVEHRGMRLSSGFLYFAIHRRRRPAALRVASLGELLALSATEFEEAVAQSLRDRGYSNVQRRGGPSDLGVDITCTDRNGERLALQCKRYAPGSLVGSRDLQLFIGMIHTEHNVDRGVYVTTSGYTIPARQLANRHNINLIDGQTLSRLLDLTPRTQPASLDAQLEPARPDLAAAAVASSVPVESKPPLCPLSDDELRALETLVTATRVELPLTIVKPLTTNAQTGVQFDTFGDMAVAADAIERAACNVDGTLLDSYRNTALIATIVCTLRSGGDRSYDLPDLADST
jgi:restriction system protein